MKHIDNTSIKVFQGYKSQMKIFQDIEDLRANTENVEVYYYGGSPIILDAILNGPKGSLYEGARYHIRIEFREPYPYKLPSIRFITRIFAVNVISQISGIGLLNHIRYLWNGEWTLRKLFDHISSLLIEPDYSLLPKEMNDSLELHLLLLSRANETSRSEEKSSSESNESATHSTSYYFSSSSEPKTSLESPMFSYKSYDSISDDDTDIVSPMSHRRPNGRHDEKSSSYRRDGFNGSSVDDETYDTQSESTYSARSSRYSKEDKTSLSTPYGASSSLMYGSSTSNSACSTDYYDSSKSFSTYPSSYSADSTGYDYSSTSYYSASASDSNATRSGGSSLEYTSYTQESSYSSNSNTGVTGVTYEDSVIDDTSIDSSKSKLKSLIKFLTRSEQLHLHTMLLYKFSKVEFKKMIDYCSKNHPCQLEPSTVLRELPSRKRRQSNLTSRRPSVVTMRK